MARSYRQCECGKRALSIATRCPACGRELVAPPVREESAGLDLGRLVPARALGWGLAAAVVVLLAVLGRRNGPASDP